MYFVSDPKIKLQESFQIFETNGIFHKAPFAYAPLYVIAPDNNVRVKYLILRFG